MGTDEMKFIEILVSRSRSHLQKVFEEYKKVIYKYLPLNVYCVQNQRPVNYPIKSILILPLTCWSPLSYEVLLICLR